MSRSLHLLPILSLPFVLAACSTNEPAPEAAAVEIKPEPRAIAARDATLTADKKTRAGAAIAEGGYTHVLGQRNVSKLTDQGDTPTVTNDLNETMKAFDKAKDKTPNKMSESVYESARWERYCNGGKLTETDFTFIAERGRNAVPAELAANCSPPDFTRQQYLAAWQVEQCKTGFDSDQYALIRGRTAEPKATCTN